MNKTLPIGYVEVQRGWVGHKTHDEMTEIIREVIDTTSREQPHLEPYGSTMVVSTDGAGVQHYTLYAGFAPRVQTTPPLDPNNFNDAPAPQIGHALPDIPLGTKERKF